MATFGELKQKAANRLQDGNSTAVSSLDVGDAINTAIKYWKKKRFWFNEYKQTVTVLKDNPLVTVTGLLYLLPRSGMSLVDQLYTYDLPFISPDQYDGYNSQGRGRPYAYTYRNGSYELYWYPDKNYTVNLRGVKDYAPLVLDADFNDFTSEADQLVLYDALSRLYGELRPDPEKSNYYADRAQDEYRSLKSQTAKMNTTGYLARETPLANHYHGDDYYA